MAIIDYQVGRESTQVTGAPGAAATVPSYARPVPTFTGAQTGTTQMPTVAETSPGTAPPTQDETRAPAPPTTQPPAQTAAWYGTDPQKKSANDRIVQAYQTYLGRDPSEQEVLSQLSGGRYYQDVNVNYAIDQIRRSQEAQAYAQRQTPAPSGTAPGTPTQQEPTQQNIVAWLGQFDPTQGLMAVKTQFEAMFPGVRVLSDDKIQLSDGRIIDVIARYGAPDAFYWWNVEGAGGAGGSSGYPGVSGTGLNISDILGGNVWNDPSLQLLEQIARQRLEELQQNVQDPYRDNFFQMLEERIAQLSGAPFTDIQEETLRTAATDRLQRDRQAAHEEMDRRLAELGHGKGSGTYVQAHLQVDQQFDQLVNAQHQGFDVYAIEELNKRRDQALGLGGTAAQLSQSVRGEEEARRREALTIAALFPEMQNTQLMNALAVLNGSPYTGNSIFNQMLGLAQLGNQQNQYAAQQSNAFWSGLGSLLYGWGSGSTG